MKKLRIVAALVLLCLGYVGARADDKQQGGWSADLLSQILKSDTPAPGSAAPETTPNAAAPGAMVLRTYQLTNLRVGEAGKAKTILEILGRMLPPGSSIKPDVDANSLHVLTTPAAHNDLHDILSVLDVPEQKSPLTASAISPELKTALAKLAETGDQTGKLSAAIGGLKTDVNTKISEIDARQRKLLTRFAIGGIAFVLAVVVILVVTLKRRPAPEPSELSAPPHAVSTELVLPAEQLTTALQPAHDRMRNDMLGLLNEVAIKLQAQHNEQQRVIESQRRELETARQSMIEQTSIVAKAVDRVDNTTQRLAEQQQVLVQQQDKMAKQQDKVAELVDELQGTLQELDATKRQLDLTKDGLTKKEIELEQERAKIAALSILLEEGTPLPPPGNFAVNLDLGGRGAGGTNNGQHREQGAQAPGNEQFTSCTPTDQMTPQAVETGAVLRFQFLPPDHPET